jgi:hypothetical protein
MTKQFDNLSDAMLADEIGTLDTEMKAIKARLDAAKAEFKDRNIRKVEGDRFQVARSDSVRWSLDSKAVKAEMGERWYDAHSRMTNVSTIRVAAVAQLAA